MARVRPFTAADIPDVARIHQAVFRPDERGRSSIADAYCEYLTGVFLTSPWTEPDLPALVFENDRGRVSGFVGIVPRTVRSNGCRLRAAVSCQFVVDPEDAPGLVAVRLAKAFLEGPQDLSITDGANDEARGMWEKLGGQTDALLSLHWTRPLRPARLALSVLGNRPMLKPFSTVARPLATLADGLAARMPHSHFRQVRPTTTAGDLGPSEAASAGASFCPPDSFAVEYDERGWSWLLSRAVKHQAGGALRTTTVRRDGEALGWYIWHLDRHGLADLLQLNATASSIDRVLDCLFYDAWTQGATAVSGRFEPRFVQALSDKYCLFHRRGPWTLIHARRPDVLQAFWTGRVAFSRLDGEWCLAF
jgi:hypothetical protein